MRSALLVIRSEVLLDALAHQGLLVADGDGELDAVLVGEGVQPIQELLSLEVDLGANDLGQAVDEDMGDVIVAGVQAADEALHSGVISDVILAGLDQTDLVADVQHQLLALLNTNNIAVLGIDGAVDHFDNLLGLTGALLAHDNSNHVYHSLEKLTIRELCSTSC